jgi:hypothetical protein
LAGRRTSGVPLTVTALGYLVGLVYFIGGLIIVGKCTSRAWDCSMGSFQTGMYSLLFIVTGMPVLVWMSMLDDAGHGRFRQGSRSNLDFFTGIAAYALAGIVYGIVILVHFVIVMPGPGFAFVGSLVLPVIGVVAVVRMARRRRCGRRRKPRESRPDLPVQAAPLPIVLACPHCGSRVEALPDWSGQRVSCLRCRQDVQIP